MAGGGDRRAKKKNHKVIAHSVAGKMNWGGVGVKMEKERGNEEKKISFPHWY